MRLITWAGAFVAAAVAAFSLAAAPAHAAADGRSLFNTHCVACHEQGERAPATAILRTLTTERIHQTMTTGAMKPMAAMLTDDDRKAIATYLGRSDPAPGPAQIAACPASNKGFDKGRPIASNGFGVVGVDNHRLAPEGLAGLTRAALPGLHPVWSAEMRKPTFPLAAGGSLFTTNLDGEVLALSADSGCLRWRFATGGSIRSGLILGVAKTGAPTLYFGDRKGNIYGLNAATGRLVWKTENPHENSFANVLATPALHDGVLYVGFASNEGDNGPNADPKISCCFFRGMLAAFDAATGKVLWRYYTIPEKAQPIRTNAQGVQQYGPSGAAVLNTPTVDPVRGLIYATADNNYSDPRDGASNAIYALEMKTGRQVWHRKMSPGNPHNAACYVQGTNCPNVYDEGNRSDWGFKAPPVLVKTPAGELLVSAQKSGQVWGLAPATGEILWETKLTARKVNYGTLQGVAVHDGAVFATVGEFLKKPGDGPYAGMEELGLYKLDAATGKILWTARAAEGCPITVCAGYWDAPIVTGGMVVALSTDQFLRFFDEGSGALLRAIDLNLDKGARVPTSGGGPSVAGGVIYAGTDRRLIALAGQ